MKLAVVGASHWHVPLYEPGFAAPGLQLAAVWDESPAAAGTLAGRHRGARVYERLDALLESGIDLVFVFGAPAAMPELAEAVIARRLPMSLEKPCARTAAEAARIRAVAERAGSYVAVPLVQRFAAIGRALLALSRSDPTLDLSFRFIAGPPERYERAGCAWVLDPDRYGGGPVINLAVHFIDLALLLTASPARSVFARTSDLVHRRAVEDRGLLSIAHENGALTTIEVGYRFPDAPPLREFRLSAMGRFYYVESAADGLLVRSPGGAVERIPVSFDSDSYYPEYVARVAEDVGRGRPPAVGLAEIEATLAVVDAAYASARSGTAVTL